MPEKTLPGSIGTPEGVAMLILTGRYIGFLPEHYAQQWCLAGNMKPLQPQKMSYSTALCGIVRIGPAKNRLVDAFLGQLPRKRAFSNGKKLATPVLLPAV